MFDRRAITCHKVENAFIPNIENAEVKALFQQGLEIFKAHQKHAQMIVDKLNAK